MLCSCLEAPHWKVTKEHLFSLWGIQVVVWMLLRPWKLGDVCLKCKKLHTICVLETAKEKRADRNVKVVFTAELLRVMKRLHSGRWEGRRRQAISLGGYTSWQGAMCEERKDRKPQPIKTRVVVSRCWRRQDQTWITLALLLMQGSTLTDILPASDVLSEYWLCSFPATAGYCSF